jgi:hypothetical protein
VEVADASTPRAEVSAAGAPPPSSPEVVAADAPAAPPLAEPPPPAPVPTLDFSRAREREVRRWTESSTAAPPRSVDVSADPAVAPIVTALAARHRCPFAPVDRIPLRHPLREEEIDAELDGLRNVLRALEPIGRSPEPMQAWSRYYRDGAAAPFPVRCSSRPHAERRRNGDLRVTLQHTWRIRLVMNRTITRRCCPPTHPILDLEVAAAEVFGIRADGRVREHVRYVPRVVAERGTGQEVR